MPGMQPGMICPQHIRDQMGIAAIRLGLADPKPASRISDHAGWNNIDLLILMGCQKVDQQIMIRFDAHQAVLNIDPQFHALLIECLKSCG